MSNSKTFLTFLFLCVITMFNSPKLSAQESLKSQVVTEYDGKSYYIHTVQKKQSLKEIAEIYDVTVYEILEENKDVKKSPKTGTLLRIPYKHKQQEEYIIVEELIDTIVELDTIVDVVEYVDEYVYPVFDSERLYKVALMMPLYLEQVDNAFKRSEVSNKQLLSKPFSYLHFYEGFMIAVDSMVSKYNMKLDLKIYDVDQDTNKVISALNDEWLLDVDMIIGPFHVKAFEKLMPFAAENDILIVNPMTNRDELVVGNRNVVKVKPSYSYQVRCLESLIRDKYADNNVFIIAEDFKSMEHIGMIEDIVRESVNPYSLVSNKHIKDVVKKHNDAWKVEEVGVGVNGFNTDNNAINMSWINQNQDDSTMLKNQIRIFNYSTDTLRNINKMASSIRNNVFIVYGENKVFATEILNKINKLSRKFPSQLIALPHWSKIDKLFDDILMKLNAIFLDDEFVDYNLYSVGKFICKFRDKYGTEPKDIAYHGFNIAWYFLNALMNYGDNINIGITSYSIQLLGTKYSFERVNPEDGLLNTYWNMYHHQDYEKKELHYE